MNQWVIFVFAPFQHIETVVNDMVLTFLCYPLYHHMHNFSREDRKLALVYTTKYDLAYRSAWKQQEKFGILQN